MTQKKARRHSMADIVKVTRFCENLMQPKSAHHRRMSVLKREEIRNMCFQELNIEPSDTLLDTLASEHGVELTSLFNGLEID